MRTFFHSQSRRSVQSNVAVTNHYASYSEIAWERVEKVEKYLNLGDITRVKYMGIDSRTRKQKVSRKILLERPKKKE